MKYIVYVSQAQEPMKSAELHDLLSGSRTRNGGTGITGHLIYRYNPDFRRGNFLQVLEGPDDAINDVWARISQDSRHHTIVVLEEGALEERMFSDWSMGFKNVEESDLRDAPGFAEMGSDEFWMQAQRHALPSALEFLRSFYDAA